MIARDDLRAAVAAGIVTEAQAASLAALADSRRGARRTLGPQDEPFELFKGFNEIFIIVGLVILSMGWVGVSTVSMGLSITDIRAQTVTSGAIGAGAVWLLAEYFIRRRRMIGPANALAVLFTGAVGVTLTALTAQVFMIARSDYSSLPLPAALTTLALAVFWARFRVPFAMAMIALGCFAVALLSVATRQGNPDTLRELFLLSAGGGFAWVTLVLGIVVFAAAMAFDMSDPHRVGLRSANGFWLHVVAAPALVNTVALTLLDSGAPGARQLLLAILALFAIVAVVIDRRSFLIAAIGYVVALAFMTTGEQGTARIVLALGALLLALGAFWERIRARILRALPFLPRHLLPPAADRHAATLKDRP